MSQPLNRDNHTQIPARPDLIRLGIGIIGIGTSGPLIAMSSMPVLSLIFWRNFGAALMTAPFALRHRIDRTGAKWAILAGVVLALHFYDFWIPEINTKYVIGDTSGLIEGTENFRYHEELVHKFAHQPWRVFLYVLSFVMLSLHLLHGFQSSFQSVGFNHTKYTPVIKMLGNIFAIAIPLGFIFIAIYHYNVHPH